MANRTDEQLITSYLTTSGFKHVHLVPAGQNSKFVGKFVPVVSVPPELQELNESIGFTSNEYFHFKNTRCLGAYDDPRDAAYVAQRASLNVKKTLERIANNTYQNPTTPQWTEDMPKEITNLLKKYRFNSKYKAINDNIKSMYNLKPATQQLALLKLAQDALMFIVNNTPKTYKVSIKAVDGLKVEVIKNKPETWYDFVVSAKIALKNYKM